jgi:hypothetical protein
VGDGEKLLTYLNSALKMLLGLDIFPRGTKKKLNFVDQCNLSRHVFNTIKLNSSEMIEIVPPCCIHVHKRII